MSSLAFFAVAAVVLGLAVLVIGTLSRPANRRASGGPGPGAAGAVYDLLNEDKRKAIEIVLEERAAYRDPETADDIPDDEPPQQTG